MSLIGWSLVAFVQINKLPPVTISRRLRIAQEIQREQEEIEVKLKDLESRGVHIEKALRGEGQMFDE